jgi:hypothetical protein
LKNDRLSIISWVVALVPAILMSGCGVYSFSGASTSAKTIQVDAFFNNTDLAPASIAQDFTNKIKDYYQQNSSLRVVPENGELQIDGVITRYDLAPLSTTPVTPTAGSSSSATTPATNPSQQTFIATQTRLTIMIKVNYTDNSEPKNSFKDKPFSFYQDFDASANFSTLQSDLETAIFNQILIDIFNATVANW